MQKPKLHLKDLATVTIKPEPVKEPPAAKPIETAPAVAPNVTPLPTASKPGKRFTPKTPAHAEAREFTFADGRPITIIRHAVNFFCPRKEAPETETLVAIKGGLKPVPLAIPYDDFKTWATSR
jgi:hypothetical protein